MMTPAQISEASNRNREYVANLIKQLNQDAELDRQNKRLSATTELEKYLK